MTREAFEKWISSDPYNRSVARHGDRGTWPGQYKSYATQLAREAWQESARQAMEECAVLLDENAQRCGEESITRLILETNAAAIRARAVQDA